MTTHSTFLGNPCIPLYKLVYVFAYVSNAINIINVFYNVSLALYM